MWATSSASTTTANCSTRPARSGRPGWPPILGSDVVDDFDDLRAWLPSVDHEASDEVLLALAMLAAPDGGDDIAAAAALAKCLLPGACRLAGWLSTLPPREVFRDSQPVTGRHLVGGRADRRARGLPAVDRGPHLQVAPAPQGRRRTS